MTKKVPSACVIPWEDEGISSEELNYIHPKDDVVNSGVDSRAFDYLNIPYISITSIDPDLKVDNANTPNDVYNEAFIENITKNAKIAGKILLDMNK